MPLPRFRRVLHELYEGRKGGHQIVVPDEHPGRMGYIDGGEVPDRLYTRGKKPVGNLLGGHCRNRQDCNLNRVLADIAFQLVHHPDFPALNHGTGETGIYVEQGRNVHAVRRKAAVP